MARGKYRGGKATGRRTFSTQEELEKEELAPNTRKTDMPPSDSESESEDEGLVRGKGKGMEGIIETANPNDAPRRKNIKAKELGKNDGSDAEDDSDIPGSSRPALSRKEREELEKQRAQDRYWKLHSEGKTPQAKMDLDRLAIIKKQRADDALKRAEEMAEKAAKAKK